MAFEFRNKTVEVRGTPTVFKLVGTKLKPVDTIDAAALEDYFPEEDEIDDFVQDERVDYARDSDGNVLSTDGQIWADKWDKVKGIKLGYQTRKVFGALLEIVPSSDPNTNDPNDPGTGGNTGTGTDNTGG